MVNSFHYNFFTLFSPHFSLRTIFYYLLFLFSHAKHLSHQNPPEFFSYLFPICSVCCSILYSPHITTAISICFFPFHFFFLQKIFIVVNRVRGQEGFFYSDSTNPFSSLHFSLVVSLPFFTNLKSRSMHKTT